MYSIKLINSEVSDIFFVGKRYCWSSKLIELINEFSEEVEDEGTIIKMPEHKAWELRESFDMDTEGGHSFFPMLDQRSDLAKKLYTFYESVI